MKGQTDLFLDPERSTALAAYEAARTTDPATSHAAADVVRPRIGSIQRQVLNAFHRLGPMTARTAERLPIFDAYGFSTIRKRISELCRAGYLDIEGIDNSKRAPASIYRRSDKPLPNGS